VRALCVYVYVCVKLFVRIIFECLFEDVACWGCTVVPVIAAELPCLAVGWCCLLSVAVACCCLVSFAVACWCSGPGGDARGQLLSNRVTSGSAPHVS
jgi:hypothetical protein